MKSSFLLSTGSSKVSSSLTSLILRIAFAGSMLYGHGWGKFNRFFSEEINEFVNLFGIGMKPTFGLVMFAEFICAGLVVIGFLSRIALIPLIINMAYIVFIIHGADEFGDRELPALYLAAFIAIIISGSGRFSVDWFLFKKGKS